VSGNRRSRPDTAIGEAISADAVIGERHFILSPHALAVQFGFTTALFHGLTLKKIYGSTAFRAFLEPYLAVHGAPGCDEKLLLDENFLIPAPVCGADKSPDDRATRAPCRLHLLLSRHCRGDCSLCGREAGSQILQAGQARAALDMFFTIGAPAWHHASIILDCLPGPVDPDLLQELLSLIGEKEDIFSRQGFPLEVEIRTGPLPMTPELWRIIRKKGVRIKVPFEGRESDYGGREGPPFPGLLYADALRGYRDFKKRGLQPGILCAIGLNNIHCLPEIGRFFALELECRRLHVMPRYAPDESSVPGILFAEKLLELFTFFRSYGIFEEHVLARLLPFIDEEPVPHHRSPGSAQIVVSSRGALYCGVQSGREMATPVAYCSDGNSLAKVRSALAGTGGSRESDGGERLCGCCAASSLCGGDSSFSSLACCPLMPPDIESHCAEVLTMLHWFLRDLAESLEIRPGEGALIMNHRALRGGGRSGR
jgi:hypothetical protein